MKENIKGYKCKFCGDSTFVLMTFDDYPDMESYVYHYSTDYTKGCKQRINLLFLYRFMEPIIK